MQETVSKPRKKVYQFPFDEVCEQIVSELKKRHWKVPDFKVTFGKYGLDYIESGNFKLWFCRDNSKFPSELAIPNKYLEVYDDESGPTLYLYVGKDWRKDRKKFMFGRKMHTKYEGRPKIYLRYQGRCKCEGNEASWHTHTDTRAPLLWVDNDLGREYDPEGDEPTFFSTESVFWDFAQYLRDVVLSKIVRAPLPS